MFVGVEEGLAEGETDDVGWPEVMFEGCTPCCGGQLLRGQATIGGRRRFGAGVLVLVVLVVVVVVVVVVGELVLLSRAKCAS